MIVTQLDLFVPPPPIFTVAAPRKRRLAPVPDSCPGCGHWGWSTLWDRDAFNRPTDHLDELAHVCSFCGHVAAKNERDRMKATAIVARIGMLAACCIGPEDRA
jgi:hypothetical protein